MSDVTEGLSELPATVVIATLPSTMRLRRELSGREYG
jgi:hypothetical protein